MQHLEPSYEELLLKYLSGFITEKRWSRFLEIVKYRTRYLTVVLENVYQSHNASAVLRSCECFGIQDVHILEDRHAFKSNHDIVLGADKWLTLFHYKSPEDSLRALGCLKQKGYAIVATSPHLESYHLDNLPLNKKIALVFGTELEGISENVTRQADCFLKIPMSGLTESLNISVSAAIIIYSLSKRLKDSGLDWELSEAEKRLLLTDWVKNTVKNPDALENEFKRSYQTS